MSLILFVVDQVAGAEYLLPLLKRWPTQSPEEWQVLASPLAARVLGRSGIPHESVTNTGFPQALAALERYTPRIGVLSTSGNSMLERTFRAALRQRRIPCYQFIDIWANYALRFRTGENDDAPLDLPDALLTIDAAARDAMIKEGIPAAIIHIIGQPHFEARYLELRAQSGTHVQPGRVLIATQPVARYHGRSLGYDEHDFLRCCLDAWRQCGFAWELLDVAIHPEEPHEQHLAMLATYSTHIRVVEGATLRIKNYSAVLSMFSSLLVQALLAETPAASVQPGAGTSDICHLSAQGLIPRWTEVAQLAGWLDNTIGFHSSVKLARRPAATSLIESLAGSGDRLAHFLLTHKL